MTPLTDAQRDMVERNLDLAWKFISKIRSGDQDDLFQEAVMGMMIAAQRWQPRKGAYSTYAWQWMRAHVQEWLSSQRSLIKCSRGITAIPVAPLFKDQDKADDRNADAAELNELTRRVCAALLKIHPRERTAMHLCYLKEKTLSEVGAEMGISKQRVSKIVECGRERFQRHFVPA
jgi:RNA polymerase sigma factor (sigma-70 family)